MKTKLLKKVRKRFYVLKVTRAGKYDLEYVDTSKLKLPFYLVIDTHSPVYYLGATQTYEKAFDTMIDYVLRTYKDKGRRRLETEIAYYNGK